MDEHSRRGAQLIVFAKYPRPGNVKTRLVPPLTYRQAADLYAAMLCDSLHDFRALPGIEPVLYIADGEDIEPVRRLLLEKCPTTVDEPLRIFPQEGDDLGERLMNAFAASFASEGGPVAVIGTDHPSLPVEYLSLMFEKLNDHDLVLGPADDGGYYTIGLREPQPALFVDMPWSSPDLFSRTVETADGIGLNTFLLPEWYDVDDERTLRRLRVDHDKGIVGPMVADALSGIADVPSEGRREE